jgi:hypothetical protein
MNEFEKQFNELYPEEGIAELIKESGGKLTRELLFKKFIVDELHIEIHDDLMRYFDFESYELLDLKIEVMTAVKDGKVPADIPRYYEIFELLPPEGQVWD